MTTAAQTQPGVGLWVRTWLTMGETPMRQTYLNRDPKSVTDQENAAIGHIETEHWMDGATCSTCAGLIGSWVVEEGAEDARMRRENPHITDRDRMMHLTGTDRRRSFRYSHPYVLVPATSAASALAGSGLAAHCEPCAINAGFYATGDQ